MQIYKLKDMVDGWFVGDFNPAVLQTKDFEVCVRNFRPNEETHDHYHKIATEINLVLQGSMIVNEKVFKKNDIFVLYPNEVSRTEFLEFTRLLIIKTPSSPGDKYYS